MRHDVWVKRLHVGGGKTMDKAAVFLIIGRAVKFNKEVNAIKLVNTGAARGVSPTAVNKHVAAKAKSWRMDAYDGNSIQNYARKTCPVVGGVMRSIHPFEGSRPYDAVTKSDKANQSDGIAAGGAGATDTEAGDMPAASDNRDVSPRPESADERPPSMAAASGGGSGLTGGAGASLAARRAKTQTLCNVDHATIHRKSKLPVTG